MKTWKLPFPGSSKHTETHVLLLKGQASSVSLSEGTQRAAGRGGTAQWLHQTNVTGPLAQTPCLSSLSFLTCKMGVSTYPWVPFRDEGDRPLLLPAAGAVTCCLPGQQRSGRRSRCRREWSASRVLLAQSQRHLGSGATEQPVWAPGQHRPEAPSNATGQPPPPGNNCHHLQQYEEG